MPYTLLLADDSVTIQRVIELTFADEDVNVVAVSDGDQAIARIGAQPPDIVLADVGMPGKDGYEVAAHIKHTPALAHIPVVLLTGAFEPVDQARLTAAGCDGVLPKPFEPQQVIARVRELLGRNGGAHPAAAVSVAAPAAPAQTAPAPAAVMHQPPSRADLDDYFDRLDNAFAKLDAAAPSGGAAPAGLSVADQIDWFANNGAAAPVEPPIDPAIEPPLSYASPEPGFTAPTVFDATSPHVAAPPPAPAAFAAPAPAPASFATPPPAPSAFAAPPAAPIDAEPEPPAAAAPLVEAAQVVLPPLDQAFAALLAAEQNGALPEASWPASAGASAAPASDEVVAQVTQRVLAELSDRVVRDAVADLVSQMAERLIREEIERIKASIK